MSKASSNESSTANSPSPARRPYVPDSDRRPEFTLLPVLAGTALGIVFGASSLYLVLKIGLTVSASIPVAVMSITLFRGLSAVFGARRATILENNIVQTTGSAGESIAFGVGITIPALLLLGFDMTVARIMTVGVFGGLLGILMMIPLRRAFIVKQHDELPYPEGTACAEVLVVGEQGGSSAKTVFAGFGIAFLHKFCVKALKLWKEEVDQPLFDSQGNGLKGGVLAGEFSPELLGVGYIIGPKIASITMAGGVLAYLVIVPMIAYFGADLESPLAPAVHAIDAETGIDKGLIRNMGVGEIRNNYILYIGAGAVATGGIISMCKALPMIFAALAAAFRDLRGGAGGAKATGEGAVPRTERDLPIVLVMFGSLALVAGLALSPSVGLGFGPTGMLGAAMIVVFGFLFVTVSSRLTGMIGSSSNPISGMTVAALLLTCLIFLALGETDKPATLTALTVAAVVCIAASNGGTTSQDLKTGYLVGATPKLQQIAILIGALSSALVMGWVLLLLNEAGTVYTNKAEHLPSYIVPNPAEFSELERAGGTHADDETLYHAIHIREGDVEGVSPGKYLIDDEGKFCYLVDPAINGRVTVDDNGAPVANKFVAPKTRLMALIIDGILNRKLPWGLVMIGALIAIVLELAGVPSLPFAVGVYLPIGISTPIFIGGALRWLVDRKLGQKPEEAESSSGVLLSSGYIAGGAIAGVLTAFFAFLPEGFSKALDMTERLGPHWTERNSPAVAAFAFLALTLLFTGFRWLFADEKK